MSRGYGGVIKSILTAIGESDPTKRTYLSQLFHKRRYKALVAIIRSLSNKHVGSLLDVGCGKGFLYQALLESGVKVESYICLDIDIDKLIEAKGLLVCADAQDSPLTPCAVDYTVASEVLEHLDKPFVALKNMIAVTRKYMVITFPDETIKNALGFRYPEHLARLNACEVIRLVERYGLRKILHYRLNYIVPPSIYDKFLPFKEGISRILEAFQKVTGRVGCLNMIKTEVIVFKRVVECRVFRDKYSHRM